MQEDKRTEIAAIVTVWTLIVAGFVVMFLSLAGCLEVPVPPALTYALEPTERGAVTDEVEVAASVWCEIGVCPVVDAGIEPDLVIYVSRPVGLVESDGVGALADRGANLITIDASLTGLALCVAVAHEVGHVALDTPVHVVGGVMGGADCQLNDADRELARATIGARQ